MAPHAPPMKCTGTASTTSSESSDMLSGDGAPRGAGHRAPLGLAVADGALGRRARERRRRLPLRVARRRVGAAAEQLRWNAKTGEGYTIALDTSCAPETTVGNGIAATASLFTTSMEDEQSE